MIDRVYAWSVELALCWTMAFICAWYNISRQAHYQQKKRDQQRHSENERVLEHVRQVRQRHRRVGVRKLLDRFPVPDVDIGRDRLFELLREHNLLIERKRQGKRTTWAGSWRTENLLEKATLTAPNQAWVSDITYIETEDGFGYLTQIMDVYSRRIMGYDFCNSLAVEGTLRALEMAVAEVGGSLEPGLIFHSDHGVQYTCHAFRERLQKHQIRSSMGQVGNCYDNAMAERLNGILKQEYGLGELFVNLDHADLAVRQAVFLYNHERPHYSLQLATPDEVYFDYYSINLMSTTHPIFL